MKKLLILVATIYFSQLAYAQLPPSPEFDCPPKAWCHPDGAGLGQGFLGSLTSAADKVGESMEGDPCGDKSYAEQAFCYLGEYVSDVIACGYGEDTPQYTLCEDDDSGGSTESQREKAKKVLSELKHDYYTIDANYIPLSFQSKTANKAIKASLDKMKRGDVIKQYEGGYSLKMDYKFFTDKNKTSYASVLSLWNNKKSKTLPFSRLIIAVSKDGKTNIYAIKAVKYSSGKGK